MSEEKQRVILTSLAAAVQQESLLASTAAIGSKTKQTFDKSSTSGSSSIRLELGLFEPNADSFPEFNFLQLLNAEKKKRKKLKKLNGFRDDPMTMEEDPGADDEVARIAKELEEKYGAGSSYGKKCFKRVTVDATVDKGAGYDENDSFIDNTEAYDEVIPDAVEPNHGGFYINSGPLEFQNMPNYERPEDAIRMPKPKKRNLSTSSESSGDEYKAEKNVNGNVETSSQKNGQIEKKLKTNDCKSNVPGEKDNKEGKVVKESKPKPKPIVDKVVVAGHPPTGHPPAGHPPIGIPKKEDDEKAIKTTTVKDMLRLKRDNHRHMQEAKMSPSKSSDQSGTVKISSTSSDSDSSSEIARKAEVGSKPTNGGVLEKPKTSFDLPQNISVELMQNLVIIEQSARFLPPTEHVLSNANILDMLFKIEMQVKGEKDSYRDQIYTYLEVKLNCPKQQLVNKAKKLSEETKVKKGLVKLRKLIEAVMPKLIEEFERESQRVRMMKNTMNVIGIPAEEQNQLQMPKKRFLWTDTMRNCLCDLYLTKKNNFNVLKQRKDKLEDYLSNFLRQDVLTLWTSGWMKYEELVREIEKRKPVSKKQKVRPLSLGNTDLNTMSKDRVIPNSNGLAGSGEGVIITPVPTNRLESEPLSLDTKKPAVSILKSTPNSSIVPCDKTSGVIQKVAAPVTSSPSSSSSVTMTAVKHHSPTSTTVFPKSQEMISPNSVLKRNSYDYSISNLIGSSASQPKASADNKYSVDDTKSNGAGASVIKILSVASLNDSITKEEVVFSPSSNAHQLATIHCDELSSSSDCGQSRRKDGTGHDVESDSSCEIVNVVFSRSSKGDKEGGSDRMGGKSKVKNGPMEEAGGGGSGDKGSSIKKQIPTVRIPADMVQSSSAMMDTNDIDVNQIMKDLKELQQWESGNLGAKKSDFVDRGKAKKRPKHDVADLINSSSSH